MILNHALNLSRNVMKHRQVMRELTKNKDISNPEIKKIRHQLDEEIILLQKLMLNNSSMKEV